MSDTLATDFLEGLNLSAGEAAIIAVIGAMAFAVICGLEQKIAVFATIGGVIALLLSASGPV